ncbi:MAG: hypothetical protein ACLUG1_05255 [Christensenellales bacterium]
MRRLCCEKFSDFCEVRLLDEKDVELIYGLGVTNPSFYASKGFVPDKKNQSGFASASPEKRRTTNISRAFSVGKNDSRR